jgi:AcrR family transcriptional regulator
MKQDTRTRILVASLLLFNERGEPNTSINAIADAADLSPGNLHYHFRKKADIVEALLDEFSADMRRVLEPPEAGSMTVDDFWIFLHLAVEVLATYRFLFRDLETLTASYPKARRDLRRFVRALVAATHLYVNALQTESVLDIGKHEVAVLCRNLVILTLFSGRFDAVADSGVSADEAGLRIARSVLSLLLPYADAQAAPLLVHLAERYMH